MSLSTLLVLLITNYFGESSLNLLQVIAISSLAVGLEQVSPLGIDNLTVPFAVAFGWQLLPSLELLK